MRVEEQLEFVLLLFVRRSVVLVWLRSEGNEEAAWQGRCRSGCIAVVG
jgi:hypothetical protein